MNCLICGRELEFKGGKGWLHKGKESVYIVKCKDCGIESGYSCRGFEGKQVNELTCIHCGGKKLVLV